MPANSPSILNLREVLKEKFPQAHAQDFSPEAEGNAEGQERRTLEIGVPSMDAVGIPRGAITEVVAPTLGCGTGLVLAGTIEQTAAQGGFTALVDAKNAFDPSSLPPAARSSLLWARCGSVFDAIKATDLLLRDGNVPVLLLDLELAPATELNRIPNKTWYRYQNLVEQSGVTFIALTPRRLITSAKLRFTLDHPFPLNAIDDPRPHLLGEIDANLTRSRIAQPLQQLAS